MRQQLAIVMGIWEAYGGLRTCGHKAPFELQKGCLQDSMIASPKLPSEESLSMLIGPQVAVIFARPESINWKPTLCKRYKAPQTQNPCNLSEATQRPIILLSGLEIYDRFQGAKAQKSQNHSFSAKIRSKPTSTWRSAAKLSLARQGHGKLRNSIRNKLHSIPLWSLHRGMLHRNCMGLDRDTGFLDLGKTAN